MNPIEARRGPFRDLLPRLLSAIVLVVVALGSAIWGGRLFDGLWLTAGLVLVWEWQGMVDRLGPPAPAARIGRLVLSAAGLAAASALVGADQPGFGVLAILVASVSVALIGAGLRVAAAAGTLYAGSLVVGVTALRHTFPFGLEAILWLFAVVWVTDVMAYVGGRLIGGPKLWPRVSPGKTWAGFLVGIACGAIAGWAVSPLGTDVGAILGLGLLGAIAAQGGDLAESAFKRWAGVKDSSRLIPGHGGVMDRLDGFVAAVSLAAAVGGLRAGPHAPAIGLFVW